MSSLHTLRLLRCGLSDESIHLFVSYAPRLEKVDISLNAKLSDLSLITISKLRGLKDLRIRQNHRMTDYGLSQIALACTLLEKADLTAGVRNRRNAQVEIVWWITPATLQTFALNCTRLVEFRGVWICDTPSSMQNIKTLSCLTQREIVQLEGVQGEDWGWGDDVA